MLLLGIAIAKFSVTEMIAGYRRGQTDGPTA